MMNHDQNRKNQAFIEKFIKVTYKHMIVPVHGVDNELLFMELFAGLNPTKALGTCRGFVLALEM